MYEALGSANWGASTTLLNDIASETFHYEKFDNPKKICKHYWIDAEHSWRPNVNEKQIYKKILHLRKNVFIIGAGGVVPSIIVALKKMKALNIFIYNRTLDKAKALKDKFNYIKITFTQWNT